MSDRRPGRRGSLIAPVVLAAGLLGNAAAAADWPNWRGPYRNGTAAEIGLPSGWSQIWRVDFTGRSTPVVLDGRVCANGRVGDGVLRQEMVACFDAADGEKLWEYRFNVYHTTVPWNRVGWANVAGDPETGYLYVQGVGGRFFCFDRHGEVVWSRSFIDEFGFMEGYGGRTQTPVVDEDRVVVTFANTSWGDQAVPRHRLFAFDKRDGTLLWSSTPGTTLADKNTQSTPAVAVVNGQRLLIHGNGDGWIYAVKARTGEKVWGFHLSKRGINTSVLVDGTTVYAAHSEENIDEPTMGRVVAIDASGTGDVTASHEKWRASLGVGFSSPTLHGGRLYVVDNSADLHALDADTGEILWTHNLGRVGKGSAVWADGKLYVTEVNGRFLIVEPGPEGARTLLEKELNVPSGRYAEIYGSPAVAYGHVYFTTEEGLYGLGDPQARFEATPGPGAILPPEPPVGSRVGAILVVPAEVEAGPGESADFEVRAFDDNGRFLGTRPATWSIEDLSGGIDGQGRFTPDPRGGPHAGRVVASSEGHAAAARVRVSAALPLVEDFESVAAGSRPSYFLGYVSRFEVQAMDGNKVLVKGPSPQKIHRHHTFVGSPDLAGYTITADLLGVKTGRQVPDMGLINSGYTMDLMGIHQQVQIRSWASVLRMAKSVDFAWEPATWYRMKLRVDVDDDRALIRGKIWPRETEEPETWSITAEDPLPIRQGSPGLYGYSPSPIYYDNIEVTRNPS